MSSRKKKELFANPLTIDGITNSDLIPEKPTLSDFKKKTLKLLQFYEENDYKKTKEIEITKECADLLAIELEKEKARNKLLEKNSGNKDIVELNEKMKKGQLTESRKKEIDNNLDKLKRDTFEKYGIQKYLNDPNISAKKKR